MKLSAARHRNVHLEEENIAAQGKKQVVNTPRRALGDRKNVITPAGSSLKSANTIQKPTLHIVDTNVENSTKQSFSSHKYTPSQQPLPALKLDASEEEYVEHCTLEEDKSFSENLHHQNSVVLKESENDMEYWEKLLSTNDLSDVSEEDEIEMCGQEDDPEDYTDILNPVGGDALLTEEGPNFVYEKPESEDVEGLRRYTLEEMEELFDTFSDVIIV
ncbi:hypothetical protein RB195_004081 [Necator americanus]